MHVVGEGDEAGVDLWLTICDDNSERNVEEAVPVDQANLEVHEDASTLYWVVQSWFHHNHVVHEVDRDESALVEVLVEDGILKRSALASESIEIVVAGIDTVKPWPHAELLSEINGVRVQARS